MRAVAQCSALVYRKVSDSRASTDLLAIMMAVGFVLAFSGLAQSRQGAQRESNQILQLDPVFRYSETGWPNLPSSDCKFKDDAIRFFEDLENRGSLLQYLDDDDVRQFLRFAYTQRVTEVSSRSLDLLALVKRPEGNYRVFPGSTGKTSSVRGAVFYCGFKSPQYLTAEWAQAGLERAALYEPLPDPTPFDKMVQDFSVGFDQSGYEVVRESLLKRGLQPAVQTDQVIDRCGPGLELICEEYAEAACDADVTGKFCVFEWLQDADHHLMVTAKVGVLTKHFAQITVEDVRKFPPEQK